LVKADIVEEKTDIAVAGLVLVMPTISSL